jgi:hypothetical protein
LACDEIILYNKVVMSTYKLIQDIEAEDHILGPLTLRQFIFALISIFCFYISFILITKHVEFLLVAFLPPALFFGFFAVPFGRDQPTEVWALAKIRYFLKPRKRLWDQSGVKELVTITVPKKIERHLTNGLNQYEVESRLTALASTLDSRGWAIKNANLGVSINSMAASDSDPDRLLDIQGTAVEVPEEQIPIEADVLDETNSPVAQHFDEIITETSQAHRQQLINQMNAPATDPIIENDKQWFMPHSNNSQPTVTAPLVLAQDVTADEEALSEHIKAQRNSQQIYYGNLRTIQPLGYQSRTEPQNQTQVVTPALPTTADPRFPTQQQVVNDQSTQQLTDQPDPAIISLANNNDFNVDTIAREAKRAKDNELGDQEVVISLH